MGVFSELDINNNMVEEETEDHFTEEETRIAMAEQRDDERQQAESDAAQAALAKMNEESKSCTDTPSEKDSETEKRRAHEEAEAKRKAEWEAKQKAKEEAEQMAWENAVAMDDEAVVAAAVKRSGDDAERITRRNMKQCVTEVIQTRCLEDAAFARQVMHPRKTMIRCFRYITRKAKEFVKQEMEDNDEKPIAGGYDCDVPDDLCYLWAEEYFMDMDAEEDKEKEEKFVPKPYIGKPAPKSKKKTEKKKSAPKKEPPKEQSAEDPANQLTLFGVSA